MPFSLKLTSVRAHTHAIHIYTHTHRLLCKSLVFTMCECALLFVSSSRPLAHTQKTGFCCKVSRKIWRVFVWLFFWYISVVVVVVVINIAVVVVGLHCIGPWLPMDALRICIEPMDIATVLCRYRGTHSIPIDYEYCVCETNCVTHFKNMKSMHGWSEHCGEYFMQKVGKTARYQRKSYWAITATTR